jgi:hypothetical protein
VLRRRPDLDFICIQDVGLSGADDPMILEWAAQEGRVLLTHDVSTVTHYAYERVRAGKLMPGVFEVSRDVPIGIAIEDIILLAEGSMDDEWVSGFFMEPQINADARRYLSTKGTKKHEELIIFVSKTKRNWQIPSHKSC